MTAQAWLKPSTRQRALVSVGLFVAKNGLISICRHLND